MLTIICYQAFLIFDDKITCDKVLYYYSDNRMQISTQQEQEFILKPNMPDPGVGLLLFQIPKQKWLHEVL